MSNNLTRELSKRIFSNLGAIPGKIGVVGLTTPINRYSKNIKISEDGGVMEYPIWVGEIYSSDKPLKLALTNISSDNDLLDLLLIINQDETNLAVRFIWDDEDHGIFLERHDKKWIEIDLIHKLNITAAIEVVTQQGIPWLVSHDGEELYQMIIALLSAEE